MNPLGPDKGRGKGWGWQAQWGGTAPSWPRPLQESREALVKVRTEPPGVGQVGGRFLGLALTGEPGAPAPTLPKELTASDSTNNGSCTKGRRWRGTAAQVCARLLCVEVSPSRRHRGLEGPARGTTQQCRDPSPGGPPAGPVAGPPGGAAGAAVTIRGSSAPGPSLTCFSHRLVSMIWFTSSWRRRQRP